jgi:sporulation related protein
MRHAWASLLLTVPALLPLGGCLPPAVTAASYAADGVSYAVSDKSLSDHGLSVVKGEDCATWHFFVGRAVCEDPAHPLPTAALDEHRRDGSVRHVASFTRGRPGVYLAVGSFAERANAERLAGRYAAYNPRIVAATVDGRPLLRVVLGPLDAAQRAALRDQGTDGFVVEAPPQGDVTELLPSRASARLG